MFSKRNGRLCVFVWLCDYIYTHASKTCDVHSTEAAELIHNLYLIQEIKRDWKTDQKEPVVTWLTCQVGPCGSVDLVVGRE